MPVWILLSFLFVTYLPNDTGAFCFVMIVVYLYMWLRQLLQMRLASFSRPPPAPNPAHRKAHKELIKEFKWRGDVIVLPMFMFLLWHWLFPVSASAPLQWLYVVLYLLVGVPWLR
jgi:uncharacterized membrane protein YfcA